LSIQAAICFIPPRIHFLTPDLQFLQSEIFAQPSPKNPRGGSKLKKRIDTDSNISQSPKIQAKTA
jgi:hypothetical protein